MECRVCDSSHLELAIDLGLHPWCNGFLTPDQIGREAFYPLRVVYCTDCATAQLDYTVDKQVMFADHTYLSGTTRSLSNHYREVANEVDALFFKDLAVKTALDIGSNDGTQLKHFQTLGYDVLGVESSKTTAGIANAAGVPTMNAFFNEALARSLNRKFHVINAAGVFFHLQELHSVTDGIRAALCDDGVFIVQFLYMQQIVKNGAFDQIYHEHLLYYNLRTIARLLERHSLQMFDCHLSPIHGGSIVGYVSHRGKHVVSDRLQEMCRLEDESGSNELSAYCGLARRMRGMKEDNLTFLDSARSRGKTVFGMGAPAKGNTLLNYFGIGTDYLQCLVEKNPLRRGLYSPGMHIPIVLEEELPAPPDIYYVLAWNFKNEILGNNRALIDRGVEFYFPVNPPELPARLSFGGINT
jgi:SAM-dependent methyltransferase